jgi:hypothetical protein
MWLGLPTPFESETARFRLAQRANANQAAGKARSAVKKRTR